MIAHSTRVLLHVSPPKYAKLVQELWRSDCGSAVVPVKNATRFAQKGSSGERPTERSERELYIFRRRRRRGGVHVTSAPDHFCLFMEEKVTKWDTLLTHYTKLSWTEQDQGSFVGTQ